MSVGQSLRAQLGTLIVATSLIQLSNGFFGTFISLRVAIETFDAPGLVPHPGKPFQLELTPEGSVHEAMRFFDDPGRNQNAWSHMPPYYWCVAAERPVDCHAARVQLLNAMISSKHSREKLLGSDPWEMRSRNSNRRRFSS